MADDQADTFDAILNGMGYRMTWEHVPLVGPLTNDTRIDWRVTIESTATHPQYRPLVTEYHQGLGHLPKHPRLTFGYGHKGRHSMSVDTQGLITALLRRGHLESLGVRLAPPRAIDVFYCLLGDAAAIDYACYEDYAREHDLDPDSRKGEAIYRECLTIALHLRALFGEPNLETLRVACDDR
jgi:hypothetical protein